MNISDMEFESQLGLTATSPNVRTFVRAFADGRLELRPAFQRNLVWNHEQKSYLIDSILRNMPIPELYLQEIDEAGGEDEVLVVVDGQQRLSSCIEFATDRLRLKGKGLDSRWAGKILSELPPDLQKRFRRYRFLVRQLPDLAEPQLREVFQRLNRVVEPLAPQELRHAAYSSDYIKLVECSAAHPLLQGVGVFSARDYRRRGSDELFSEILYACYMDVFPNKKEGIEDLFRLVEREGIPKVKAEDLTRRLGRLFDQLALCVDDVRKTRFRNKSDFYSLALVLLSRAELLPLSAEGTAHLVSVLNEISSRIAEIRKLEQSGAELNPTDDNGDSEILKYMRAVERAASDRLNRVRRSEVLLRMLEPALVAGEPRALSGDDEFWMEAVAEAEAAAEAELAEERESLQRMLSSETEDR